MEEIAGFEDRLAGLKERGAHLVQGCSDRVQSKLRQQVQAHQQGIKDSYSAICSTAQRVSEVAVDRQTRVYRFYFSNANIQMSLVST